MLTPEELEFNTKEFIKKYCKGYSVVNSRPPMSNSTTINRHWDTLVEEYKHVNQDKVKEHLRWVNYHAVFLTSYWWYVIRHKRKLMDGFKCTTIGCDKTLLNGILQVHHIGETEKEQYEHRGEEIKLMDCIITLCKDCHNKIHGKKPKKLKKKKAKKRYTLPYGKNFIYNPQYYDPAMYLNFYDMEYDGAYASFFKKEIENSVNLSCDTKKCVITINDDKPINKNLNNDEYWNLIFDEVDKLLITLNNI